MPLDGVPPKQVLVRLAWTMAPVAGLLTLGYWLQPIELTGELALASYWITVSGGTHGTPLIGIAMTALVVGRPGLSWRRRGAEILAILLGMGAVLGAAAYLNEHYVKPFFAVPRPNITELAGAGIMPMSVESFYAKPTKEARSEYLRSILLEDGALHQHVREHWIVETGYSFPSGHSFSAMLFATFFLAMGLSHFSGMRLWLFYSLALWALAICFSRTMLRVHSPTDVFVGGVEGVLGGLLAFLLVRGMVQWFSNDESAAIL